MKPTLLTVLIATLLLTGCGPGKNNQSTLLKKLTGKPCTVQFDRQVLGTCSDLPVPPMSGAINGAATCVSGTLRKYDSEWLVLEVEKSHVYIPIQHVLLIQHHR